MFMANHSLLFLFLSYIYLSPQTAALTFTCQVPLSVFSRPFAWVFLTVVTVVGLGLRGYSFRVRDKDGVRVRIMGLGLGG